MSRESRYIRRGATIVTKHGEVVRHPKRLPQERYLVSAPDGLHYQVYRRAGWFWRLLHGKPWRCISGERVWDAEYDAWAWVEEQCVNHFFGEDDWHGVGYARWMQRQTTPDDDLIGFGTMYTTEPLWVDTLYRNGPPEWA